MCKMGSSYLNCEYQILQTFRSWPVNLISAESMTTAGFYYLPDRARVCCAFCNVEVVKL